MMHAANLRCITYMYACMHNDKVINNFIGQILLKIIHFNCPQSTTYTIHSITQIVNGKQRNCNALPINSGKKG